jgi:RNA-binding protein YhbY
MFCILAARSRLVKYPAVVRRTVAIGKVGLHEHVLTSLRRQEAASVRLKASQHNDAARSYQHAKARAL